MIKVSRATRASDPALIAVNEWLDAFSEENGFSPSSEHDRHADALAAASLRAYWKMARTKPTTPEGRLAMLRALLFDQHSGPSGQFENVGTWNIVMECRDGRDNALLSACLA
jgi:hypothetical protein